MIVDRSLTLLPNGRNEKREVHDDNNDHEHYYYYPSFHPQFNSIQFIKVMLMKIWYTSRRSVVAESPNVPLISCLGIAWVEGLFRWQNRLTPTNKQHNNFFFFSTTTTTVNNPYPLLSTPPLLHHHRFPPLHDGNEEPRATRERP